MSRMKPTSFICGLLLPVVVATLSLAHEDEEFQNDRQDPYDGPGWRRADGGAPPIVFPNSGILLQSWIPLVEFDPTVTSADDCWGYVSPSGREYALIGLSVGTGFVEVTDPGDPQILTVMTGPHSIWRDIKVYQHYAYVVSEGGSGIQVFDLAQIDSGVVTIVKTVVTGGRLSTHNVAINPESGFLYRVGGGGSPVNGLRIYSLSDPEDPTFVAEWNDRYCHDAQVVMWTDPPFAGREIAFCFANDTSSGGHPGVEILDVTDKANITTVGAIDLSLPLTPPHPARFSHQGWLSPNRKYLYFGDEVDEGALGTPTTTRVIDISDLTDPVQAGTISNGGTARDHNLYTLRNLIFEANYRSGLRVFDVTDPLAAQEVAYFDTFPESDAADYNGLWNVYPYLPSGIVLGSDIEKGLFVWSLEFDEGPTIPAVSDWGLATMAILLATAATILLRHRQPCSMESQPHTPHLPRFTVRPKADTK